nr:uncharacterized protein LOC123772987 [Procambarus clarkii]
MEIHKAVADFSEDLVLAYLRQRSEAVGIPCEYTAGDEDDAKYTYSSDDERERFGEDDRVKLSISANTLREGDHGMLSVRVKDRAKSIDSGVCVESRRENGRGKRDCTEDEERDSGLGEYPPPSVNPYDSRSYNDAVAGCSNAPPQSHDYEDDDNANKSLVLTFKKGDLFAVVEDSAMWTGVMALRTAAVGYVPTSYLKFVEERHLWLTTAGQKRGDWLAA